MRGRTDRKRSPGGGPHSGLPIPVVALHRDGPPTRGITLHHGPDNSHDSQAANPDTVIDGLGVYNLKPVMSSIRTKPTCFGGCSDDYRKACAESRRDAG